MEEGSGNKPKVIAIVGPTCSGKTNLAIEVASKLKSEIISADSRQFYKYLNIGTAKPTSKQRELVKHHLIDFLNPDDDYNVSSYSIDANKIIESIHKFDKIPVVVGGSGLYIKALIEGISETANKNEEIRKDLLEKRKQYGNDYLFSELKKVDKISAESMLPQNWKRVMRALEVYYSTGKPIWQHHKESIIKSEFDFRQFGLLWSRENLYKNIELRVDQMIDDGLVKEVELIIKKGFNEDLNSLNTVGYKEIISFLKKEISLERAIELIKRNTRRYAKRQMTWFNKDKRVEWINVNNESDFKMLANQMINKI